MTLTGRTQDTVHRASCPKHWMRNSLLSHSTSPVRPLAPPHCRALGVSLTEVSHLKRFVTKRAFRTISKHSCIELNLCFCWVQCHSQINGNSLPTRQQQDPVLWRPTAQPWGSREKGAQVATTEAQKQVMNATSMAGITMGRCVKVMLPLRGEKYRFVPQCHVEFVASAFVHFSGFHNRNY